MIQIILSLYVYFSSHPRDGSSWAKKCACVHAWMCACMCMHVCVCMCVRACAHVCVCTMYSYSLTCYLTGFLCVTTYIVS